MALHYKQATIKAMDKVDESVSTENEKLGRWAEYPAEYKET